MQAGIESFPGTGRTSAICAERSGEFVCALRGISDCLRADIARRKVCATEVIEDVAEEGGRHWLGIYWQCPAQNLRLVLVGALWCKTEPMFPDMYVLDICT